MSNVQSFFYTAKNALVSSVLMLLLFLYGPLSLSGQVDLEICPSGDLSDGQTVSYSIIATGNNSSDEWDAISLQVIFDESRLTSGSSTTNSDLNFVGVNSFGTGVYDFEGGIFGAPAFSGTTPVTVLTLEFTVIGNGPTAVTLNTQPAETDILRGGSSVLGTIFQDLSIDPIPNQSVEEGQTLNVTPSTDDNCGLGLTYSIDIQDGNNNSVPSGNYTFNSNDGSLSWNPGVGEADTYAATLSVSNGFSEETESFDIEVTPAPNNDTEPVITLQGTASVDEDGTLNVPLSISDGDGDNLTVSISSVSNEPTLLESNNAGNQRDPWPNNADGFLTETGVSSGAGTYGSTLSFTPTFGDGGGADGDGSGTYTITVSVDDEDGNTITQDLTLTVNDVPQPLSDNQTVRIEAESFDNQGGTQVGDEGIGVEDDPAGFVNIGFTHNGDFAEYEIDVPQAGTYEFTLSIAKGSNQAGSLDINGDAGSAITLNSADNNGWGTYSDYVTQVDLPAGPQTLRLNWTSGGAGFLFNIDYFDIAFLGAGNDAPVLTITSPTDNATFTEGDNISFAATANDTEDGDLTASIDWVSSLDGTIATDMGSFSSSALSVGTHTITAEVTDSDNETTAEQVIITVNAANPGTFQLCVACGSVGLNAFGRTFIGDNNNTPPTGQGFTRTEGKTFKGYSGPIAGTSTPDELLLFQKEIFGGAGGPNPSFTYEVPVTNGSYEVDLYFAEVFQDNPGTRVFDLTLEGALLLPDYDMMNPDRDGLNSNQTAITRTYQVDVSDGSLTITVGPAAVDNGKLAGFCVTEIADANLPPTSAIADITIDAEVPAGEALNINDPESEPLTVTLSGLPTGGTLAYNASTNQLEGTPTAADAGTYTIDVIVEDGTNAGILDQFTLLVNPPAGNDPPTIDPVSDLLTTEGGTASTTVSITDDNNVFGGSIVVYDKSVVSGSPDNVTPGGVVDPGEYSFTDANNDGTYDFSWNTGTGDGRSYRVDVTADDGVNPPVTTTFNVQVGIPLLGTFPARYFGNPAPWYGSSQPQTPFTVAIESNAAENIGYIDDGDFVDYFIDVPTAGTYDVAIQAAKGSNGTTTVSLEADNGGGLTQTGSIGVVNNGSGWQDYATYNTTATFTSAGLQVLRLAFNGGANILDLTFTSQNTGDVTPPVITITGDNPLEWPLGTAYVDPGATASDDTDGVISGSIVTDASNVDVNTLGTYQVTYNVSDAAGNPATQVTRTVNVTDQDPPVITLIGDPVINLLVGDTYNEQGATATDNVDGAFPATVGGDAVDPNTIGTYVVTYDAQDAAGNPATQVTRTVNVSAVPNTDVIISATPPTQTVNQGETFTISVDMNANDQEVAVAKVVLNYDPAVLTINSVTPNISVFPSNPDNGDPANDDPGVLTYDAGKLGTPFPSGFIPLFDVEFQAVGSGTANIDIDFETTETTLISSALFGQNELLTAVNDATVTINPTADNTPPVITLLGDNPLNLFVGDTYTDPGATAVDDNDGDISDNIVVGGDAVNTNAVGSYLVTYDVSDAAQNDAQQKVREVIVSEAPITDVIMSVTPDMVTVDQGQTFTVSIDLETNDQEVSVAELFLNYDPSILTITNATPDQSALNTVLINDASQPGVFQFTSGKLGQPFPTGSVPLVDIEFQAIGSGTSPLDIDFETAQTSAISNVLLGQAELLTSVNDGTVTVNANPEITLLADPGNFTANVGSTTTQPGTLTGDANDQSTIPTISLSDDAAWLTVPATAPQGSPVNFTVDPTGLAAGTYTATITGSAAGYQDGTATVTLQVLGVPEVQVSITPNSGLNASTFGDNSFQIDYLDDGNANVPLPNIQSISFDLSPGILPDMVFDPVGLGGDATAKCFTPNTGAAATGVVTPGDPCTDPFSVPRNGGFDVMTINFGDFNEGENFGFTTDVDPNNIQGVSGAGDAGAVSGFELAGTKVTITFDNGLVLSGSMFEDGSLGGSTTIGAQAANVPNMPVLSTANGTDPQTVNTTNQTITVTGDPGSYVGLLQMDTRLYIASGDPPFDVAPEELPFYANEAMAKGLYTAQVGANGSVDIPVTLQQTPGANNTPDGGLNYFMAVTSDNPYAVGQEASMSSAPLIIKLDLGAPVITLLADPVNFTANVGSTTSQTGTLTGDASDQSTIPTISLADDAAWLTVPATAPQGSPVNYTVDPTGLAAGTYTATITGSAAGYQDGTATVTLQVLGVPEVQVSITPNSGLNASTFTNNSFQIDYLDDGNANVPLPNIQSISFDLSSGILPDMVFDPVGLGGDATAKCFTPNTGAAATGVVTPGDPCTDPFSVPRNGGFDVMTINFGDFGEGENFGFTTDVDPNNIQGVSGAGDAGAVSGFELAGTKVTITFDNGLVLSGSMFEDGSLGGSTTIGTQAANVPIMPVLSTANGTDPQTANTTNQTITVTGDPGSYVGLLQMDARLYIASGDPPFDVAPEELPFYANEAMAKGLYTAQVGANGSVDIPVTLQQTPGANNTPDGGLNYFMAVTSDNPYAVGQEASMSSAPLIIKLDLGVPVITLLGDNPLELLGGETYIEPGATATDNEDGDITADIVIDASAVNTAVAGTYEVTYNVTDGAGNAATEVVRTVTVLDNDPPVITLLGDDPLLVPLNGTYADPGATAFDAVDGDLTAQIVVGGNVVNTAVVGTYLVTYDVSDLQGNPATQVVRTVEVFDDVPPVITLVGDNPQFVPLNGTYTELGATATDNVDGDITGNIVTDASAVDVNNPGSYIVTYSVSDSEGNDAAEVTRTVTVEDQTPPVITLLGDNPLTVPASTPYVDPGATASDNIDGDISGDIVIDDTDVDVNLPGTYTVTFNVTDAAGNDATEVTRTVIVEDQTAPVITLNGPNPLTLAAGSTYFEAGATAQDNVDGDISGAIVIDNSDLNTNVPGSYEIIYSVSDAAGNPAQEIRTVIVEDQTAPVITLISQNPLTVPASSPYNDPGAIAIDNVDGNITANIVVDDSDVDTDVPGTYVVTYNVSDAAGNAATEVTRTVTVEDVTPPVITLNGANPLNLAVGDTYNEPGATATDNVDGDLTGAIVIDASAVNTTVSGSYQVTYEVMDAAGNTATAIRMVNVSDQGMPFITLLGDNPLTIQAGSPYVEPGATATDDIDGDLSDDIVIDATNVDTDEPGEYEVTYNVIDGSGNLAIEVIRTVIVEDMLPPVIGLLGTNPQEVAVGAPYVEAGAVATDDVDGNISGQVVIDASAVNTNTVGDYIVTYNVMDASGNAAQEVTRTVQVRDQTAPVITLVGDNPQLVAFGGTYTEQGATATDNVNGDISGQILIDASAVDPNALGSYTVTYNVMDAAGNAATEVTRTVTVTDQMGPVITLLGDNPLELDQFAPYVEPGATATDDVDGDVSGDIVIDASAVDESTPGSYSVTYNVMDSDGNMATEVIRTVNVNDVTAPAIALLGANPLNLAVGDTYVEAGAIATDDVDGNLNSSIMIDDSEVDMNAPGTYEVVYTVADAAGNMAMVKRTVNVTDQDGPVITLIGPDPIVVPANNPYTDPGATATDFVDGDVSGDIVIDATTVDVTTLGTYTVTFNVTDAAGNAAAEVTRTVEVIAPATLLGEITLEGNTNQAATDLILKLYEPGTNNQVGGDYAPASDNSGLFSIGDLPFGTYDVYIKKSNFLQVVATNVTLNSGSNPPVVFPTMLAGDADGDNEVTAFDYDIYETAYGSETGDATFDARTDYNRDGLIFLQDFSLLMNNLNLKGADPADNE